MIASFNQALNNLSFFFYCRFNPDLKVVHVRDLNFVLRSEIFVNSDE